VEKDVSKKGEETIRRSSEKGKPNSLDSTPRQVTLGGKIPSFGLTTEKRGNETARGGEG